MPDESRTPIIGDRIEIRLDRLEQGQQVLIKEVAEVKGELRQMDKRLSNVETTVSDLRRDIRQVLFFVVGAILVPILIEVAKRAVH